MAPRLSNEKAVMDSASVGSGIFNTTQTATLVSPCSSFASRIPSCEKISLPPSSSTLRRSTLDLGQIRSSTMLSCHRQNEESQQSKDTPSRIEATEERDDQETLIQNDLEGRVDDAIIHCLSVMQKIFLVDSGIRSFLGEAQYHVGNVFGFLVSSMFANNSNSPAKDLAIYGERETFEEPDPDPPLSPARVTQVTSSEDSKEDVWGHFADFQEELADERSFIPSCSARSKSHASLSRLDEDEEGEDAVSI